MDIYVRNLSREVTEEDLQQVFSRFGNIDSVKVVKDSESGISAGFGFVSMPDHSQALTAINALKGHELKGKTLHFNDRCNRFERRRGEERRTNNRGGSERRKRF